MSLIKDVKTILENKGLAEDIFLSFMPDQPDNIVAIFATGGFQRSSSGSKMEEPTFQIRVRNLDYEEGHELIANIKDFIHNLNEEIVGVVRYASFYQIGDVMDLGRDSNNRMGFSINFSAYVDRNFDTSILDIEEAKRLVFIAEREKRQKEVDEAIIAIDKVIDIGIKQELIDRIQVVQEYVDTQKNLIDNLKIEINTLNLRIIALQEQLENGGGETCIKNKILIDLGTEQYKTEEGNWNNLTDPINGDIRNLINESGISTGFGIKIHLRFDEAGLRGMDTESEHYYNNVLKDNFLSYGSYLGKLKIYNLNPNKYYRITLFSSSSHSSYRSSTFVIGTDSNYYPNQAIYYNYWQNVGETIAKTLKPNINGEIYINTPANSLLNALEIEEL